jgi:TPR repeat protein
VKAVTWYTKSAKQGNTEAQSNLGFMYITGRGVPQDDQKAGQWYTKAAEQGDALAQLNLGTLYQNGRGVPQDYVKAHMWFNLSAAIGGDDLFDKASEGREEVASKMTPQQIAEAQRLAREWTKKHGQEK